ncbi:VPDSG-CTERM sorting domain-containing protein [Horticoccus sp. 23ND18S-11]|uniref:VPDSG-CTERM sorting domain-containing protein n=1 Tax=Horticoccus sp. 23ND18S-11 TaxID=3391832 RepID=UPI0039C95743
MKNLTRISGSLCAALFLSVSAHAVVYNFANITAGVLPADNAADQVSVDVVNSVAGTVRFNFSFAGGDVGTIASIGFGGSSSGLLMNTGTPLLFQSAGVSFENGGMPALGAGGFTQDYGVSRTSAGGISNGLNSGVGETLGVQYALAGTNTYADVLAALNAGNFKIGLHIQQIDGDPSSQKAVLTPPGGDSNTPGVPDGGNTAALLGLALVGAAALRRKFAGA